MQAAIAQSHLSDFRDEVSKRRKVLRKLGHITDDGMLTIKGKAAAEVRMRCIFVFTCETDVTRRMTRCTMHCVVLTVLRTPVCCRLTRRTS